MASIKKKSSGGGGANWMDTYGDMVTLLLCFFVLLYSISSLDEAKWMIVVQSFNKDAIVTDDTTPKGPTGEQDDSGGNDMPMTQDEVDNALEELYQYLQTAASASDTGSITVTPGDGYVFLSFEDAVFFEGNRYQLRPEGQAVLDYIIPALEEAGPFIDEIRVLGHTAQALPDRRNTVRGDRTLSTQRADEVLIYILENSNSQLLDPARCISQGYGQWRPIAENDTAEGRAKNRRVEMMISGRDVQDSMDDNIKSYYAETNQEQPEDTFTGVVTDIDAPVVDQHALDMLGHSSLSGSTSGTSE